jgi:hypothetical protein
MSTTDNANGKEVKTKTQPKCGIVMPISAIDGLTKEHWVDVLQILKEAISSAGFEANLVSDADEVSIIQKTIVQNLYNNEVVVCDVSGKNPNVMFELGMRLAFDKPTIIIKDDKTDFTFDTSVIEHLSYPRDLRFTSILLFKELLSKKIVATFQKASQDPSYTTFLKNFGEFKVAQITQKEISSEQFVFEALKDLQREVREIKGIQSSTINANRDIINNHEIRTLVNLVTKKYMDDNGITMNDLKKPQVRKSLIHEVSRNDYVHSLLEKGNIDELHLNNLITSYLVS